MSNERDIHADIVADDHETAAALLQTVVEIDRGLSIISAEISRGRVADAQQSIRMIRELVKMQDGLIPKLIDVLEAGQGGAS